MKTLFLASTILIIGDSHTVGPFGRHLDKLLRQEGNQVATYASCGSIAKHWQSGQMTTCGYFSKDLEGISIQASKHETPIFKDLLRKINPTHVIIELGTNYVYLPSDTFAVTDMRKMALAIKAAGARCFWIGAPDMRKFRDQLPRFKRLIDEAVGSDCEIFDSETVTQYPPSGGDGVHYWSTSGTPRAMNWAREVADWFQRNNE